jgi:hypothetical protein
MGLTTDSDNIFKYCVSSSSLKSSKARCITAGSGSDRGGIILNWGIVDGSKSFVPRLVKGIRSRLLGIQALSYLSRADINQLNSNSNSNSSSFHDS